MSQGKQNSVLVAADRTLQNKEMEESVVIIDATAGNVTVTVPDNPPLDAQIECIASNVDNTATFDLGSNALDGGGSTFTIAAVGDLRKIRWCGETLQWRTVARYEAA